MRRVCDRYGVVERTVNRWIATPAMGFPKPATKIGRRRYWRLEDLERWERDRAGRLDSNESGAAKAQ